MMRAIEIERPGGPEVLRMIDMPRPRAKAGEVVIRIFAAGVNRPDIQQRRGRPLVVGEVFASTAHAPTVLVYAHLDVQPPDQAVSTRAADDLAVEHPGDADVHGERQGAGDALPRLPHGDPAPDLRHGQTSASWGSSL